MRFSQNTLFKFLTIFTISLGVILRLKTYLLARPLWHDEASVAASIITRGLFDFFRPLDFIQMVPPFFMMSVEMITKFLGEAELQLRLFPFLSGIISIILFYKLSTQLLKKPSSIMIANLLFAINYNLIYFAQELKQYSSDVMFLLIALLMFKNVDFKNLGIKRLLVYSILSIALIFFSYSVCFVIVGFIITSIFPIKKETLQKVLIYTIPIAIFGLLYYWLILSPAKNLVINACGFYWDEGFISLKPESIFKVLNINFSYLFYPNIYSPAVLIAPLIGLYLTLKENKQLNKIILATLGLATLASLFHLYPLKDRLTLYLVPIIIVLATKPIDIIDFKNKKTISIIITTSLILGLGMYNHNYLTTFFSRDIFQDFDAKTPLEIVAKNYKPKDIFVYNDMSEADFVYYKKYFNFSPKNSIKIDSERKSEEDYFKKLDNLKKDNTYWFYFPFDFIMRKKEIEYVEGWLSSKNIKYKKYEHKRSRLIYATI